MILQNATTSSGLVAPLQSLEYERTGTQTYHSCRKLRAVSARATARGGASNRPIGPVRTAEETTNCFIVSYAPSHLSMHELNDVKIRYHFEIT